MTWNLPTFFLCWDSSFSFFRADRWPDHREDDAMTSGPIIMGLDQSARSHRAPDTRRETNIIDFYPATDSLVGQREDRLSEMFPPAGGRAAQAGLYVSGQGNSLSHSFSTRAALKLAQIADTVFNVFSGLLIALFVLLLFASPFIALGCLIIA